MTPQEKRARRTAIVMCAEARGRKATAKFIAQHTTMGVEDARRILADAEPDPSGVELHPANKHLLRGAPSTTGEAWARVVARINARVAAR